MASVLGWEETMRRAGDLAETVEQREPAPVGAPNDTSASRRTPKAQTIRLRPSPNPPRRRPSRPRPGRPADGLMARRENWWWMPRVLITLTALEEEHEIPARRRGEDALLVRPGAEGAAPRVDTVTARAWPEEPGGAVELWRRDGAALEGTGEPAFAFAHRHSPDSCSRATATTATWSAPAARGSPGRNRAARATRARACERPAGRAFVSLVSRRRGKKARSWRSPHRPPGGLPSRRIRHARVYGAATRVSTEVGGPSGSWRK
ncbi:hypothetical protein [Streptomonospora wellingtoniae]|uniref:Uncharacterized protein n=1 Tax=Streptomonospora wellingtoniae TaxID=3075544 RepID=A0ABU2KTX9_9ACTN|nr:hypothetical protein [Streptomonospora sp. DSM 45055]MDT0302746.1 hypothetical protein [Streptomonospora sp. DSM 45055]